MSDEKSDNGQSFLIYQDDNGISNVTVRFEGEDVWLTQQQLAELFLSSRTNVVEHIQNIYQDKELDAKVKEIEKELGLKDYLDTNISNNYLELLKCWKNIYNLFDVQPEIKF